MPKRQSGGKGRHQRQHSGTAAATTSTSAMHAAVRKPGSRDAALMPKLVAFDLDACLWWPEMWCLSGAPFKRGDREGRLVIDRAGEAVRLMGASHDIFRELLTAEHFRGCEVAYVSRCDRPAWAAVCLQMFEAVPGVPLVEVADYSEIYAGTKAQHFRAVHKASGVPYRDMLFFDNEMRNCRDVAPLGVTCAYAPDGMTAEAWEAGLAKHAKEAAKRPPASSSSKARSPSRVAAYGSASDDEWSSD